MVTVELLAGRHPLAGNSPMEAMLQVTDPQRWPPPRTQGVAVSEEGAQLFARALALDPAARPSDAQASWRALGAACREAPAGQRRS